MIFTDSAVVLVRKDIREADRIASVYTARYGRINVRFPGVNRAKGKLKAFAEPFCWSEMRIYRREGATVGCVAGGKIISVFPSIRADREKTMIAQPFCELLFRMTPEAQPSVEKYLLITQALSALETGGSSSILRIAYLLRLMQIAGLGLERPVLNLDAGLWDAVHNAPLNELDRAGFDAEFVAKLEYVARRFASSYFDSPLGTAFVMGGAGKSFARV